MNDSSKEIPKKFEYTAVTLSPGGAAGGETWMAAWANAETKKGESKSAAARAMVGKEKTRGEAKSDLGNLNVASRQAARQHGRDEGDEEAWRWWGTNLIAYHTSGARNQASGSRHECPGQI